MAKIQVQMGFTADTTQAQSAIQQLQNSLQSIATTKVNVQGGSIDQAVQSARQLSQHLAAATNVNTGKIDFSALQTSLKAANTDLTTLTNNLLAMGPKGQQAFSQVANAVAHAELSVKKTNSALASFGVTLMNTIKWQAASTMIHGAMSAFSDAVQHIEKLDRALNDIQIVSGKTASEMAGFAKRAQELSKALSSTTTEYSKAALIFYQQGLGEKEVLDRTEATIKMAKVVGESVETVSDQLTAIWNNFDNGSKSLEYYVDVITALGAATASSTDEISDGLQKFAAVAETVGLSYEYAATALATITAETRQSADVVGTALKTLFARMEGLKLGETLEDGTTLNQYSQAMAKVGINIKDANGNLKDMDIILDEMGAKWQTLNKDQQVALAQQVGGIRQYNQLIALMDNWDTFKINLEIAEDSEGTLDKQMDIYQTSVEASEKALQNAKETLYETLFNADALKTFNNGLAEILEIITRIVDSAGGLKGLLQFGGLLVLKTLLPHLQGFITKITSQISNVIGLTRSKKIDEVGKMAKTERKIAGQEQSRSWSGKGEKAGKAFTRARMADEQGNIDKRDKFVNKGKKIATKINKKEQSITDHRTAADDARAAREKENLERVKAGKRAKTEGFGERWHNVRADQLEERATTGKAPTATTLGIKPEALPSAQTVDSSASTGTMSTQISQEQAGYTAAILDSKREYLILENQLTDAQKAQYKNYEDQINAENDLLRIARERQLASKDQADETARAAENAIEMSESGGERISSAAQKKAKEEIDQSDIGKRKKAADDAYEEEIAKIDKDGALSQDQKESAKKVAKDKHDNDDAVKNYDKEVTDRANTLMSSDDFTRTVDLGGAKTQGASAGLSRKIGGSEGAEQISMGNVAEAAGMGADGSGAAVASVENLEKLGALQGQYNADAQIAVDLQGELGTAIGAAATSTKKGTKEYETANKALKQSGTFAQKYGNEMKAAAKELQKAGELTEDQVKAVEDLVDAGADVELEGMDPKALEGVQKTLGKVEGGLTKAGAAAGQMADTMATDMAAATGATKDTFTAVTAGAQQLATDTANADQQANNLRNTMQQPLPVQPDPYGGLVMGAQGAMQAITGLAMGAQMLQTGLSMAFDPDATGIEKLTSMMMIMQGVQSLMTAAQGMYNVAVGVGNIIEAAALAIKEKGFVGWIKDIALKGVDTAATLVNAVAKVFNAEASKGLAGVIIGILAAALIIGTIAMVANTVKTEQNTKAAQESADKKKEQAEGARAAAEAAREELDAVIELTNAYMDALKIYEETGEGKEELRKAAFEAIDAMNLEGHELEILAGNYANLTKEIQKYNAAKAGKAVGASNVSLASGGAAMLAMENVSGTGGLWTTTEGSKKYLTLSLNEKNKTNDSGDALHRWLAANDSPWSAEGTGNLRAEYTDSAQIPYLMKEFYRLYDGVAAIATASEQENMAFFSEAQEMRDSGTWDYGQEIAATYDTHTDTAVTAAKATKLVDVDSQAEYNKAYQQMVEYALEAHGLKEEASKAYKDMSAQAKAVVDSLNTNLSKDENWMDFELKRRGLSSFEKGGVYEKSAAASYYSEKDSDGKTALEKWAEENDIDPDDAIDLFLKINPQFIDNETEIQKALDRMQDYLDSQTLIVKYDLVKGAQSALKEQMSSSDWSNFYDQYKDLFNPESENYIGVGFKEFTEKSYSERQALLNAAKGSTAEELNNQAGILEEGLDTYLDSDYKKNYIAGKKEELTQDYNDEVDAVREEVQTEYTGDMIKDFTSTGSNDYGSYMSEATRWNKGLGVEGGMTQAEYNSIDSWAMEKYNMTGSQYLDAKWKYLNAMNGQNGNNFGSDFDINNIVAAPEDVDGRAEAAYDEFISGQKTAIQATKDEAHLAALEELDSNIERYDLDSEAVYDYAEALEELPLVETREEAVKLSVENSRMNKGLEDLASGFEEWSAAIGTGKTNSQEYVTAMKNLKSTLGDVLTIDASQLSDGFFTTKENLELMKQAAEGNVEAIEKLRLLAAEDIILHTTLDEASKNDLIAQMTLLSEQDIEIGASLNSNKFAEGLYDAAIAAGMTVDDIQAMFDSLGWEPDIKMETYTLTDKDVTNGYIDVPADLEGNTQRIPLESSMTTGATITYPVIQNGEGSGGGFSYRGAADTTANTSSSSGGGGGEPKKTQRTHQTDVVERYKELNDQLSDTKKAMDDAARAAEGLWGAARIKKMREVQAEMGKELKLLRQKKAEAEAYLEQDRKWLEDIAAENGVTFTFDGNNISNYEEVMNGLYQELRQAEIDAGPTTDDNEQKRIDEIQERIDAIKDAIDIYDQTKDEVKDFDTEIQEAIRSIQEAKLDELNLELEMEIMIDDSQLAKLEYYLGKVQEDIWGMAEAAALMTGRNIDMFGFDEGQADVWLGKFDTFKKRYDDLVYNYTHINPETGETFINQEQFVKALQELQNDIYSNLSNIDQLDKTMIGYYGETLAAAAEELSKFTDMMDHHNDVLDHYMSLLEIMGKSKDFERMKTLLKTQVEVAENSAKVSKANYEMLQAELQEKKAAYDALDPEDTSYEAQVIRQQWLDAQAAANEAQLKMLEDAEAWAEALKALLETELEELGENLEKALSGEFGSLDNLMTSMERANSLQEEYLTTTNKIYETNKLMRTAQQEIDKTSNTVAKRRMAQFIEETQQMQNQNKLSSYELEIQQAKYDLLLAEIALEEAQSAKSTVRLQRDNEGNFGYVYTADQNEVANAQQQLEDAQNALYNIGLEGANKYAEQYAQTIQEMNDAVRELTEQWQNGEIASKEEYQAKMLELEEYYGEKLKQFSHLHSIAVQTDSRVANDAWTRDFAHMTTQTEYWMGQVSNYADQVGQAFSRYQAGIKQVEQYAGADLDSLKTKTEDIKKENEALVGSITDPDKGLLAAMQKEIDKVDDITKKYQDWRKEIQGAIDDQRTLAGLIGQDIENETDDDESNDRKPEEDPPADPPPEDPPSGDPGDSDAKSYQKGTLSWTGNGSSRIWTDSEGKTYKATSAEGKAIQSAFNRAYSANGGYQGDYFLGWNKLNADVLHAKYGLSTGGYTGDWAGSFGKLAFLHQKELVLNKQDTENLLAAMEFLNRITSAIDLQAMNSSLGGLLNSPSLGHMRDESGILEQQVHIEASFPGVSDRNELEEAFNNLINQAAQYANRK